MGATTVYRSDLPSNLTDFYNFITRQVYSFGETWALAMGKSTIAEKYGMSLRTVQRYLTDLEDQDYISTATKRGKGGGTVIVFNKDKLDFEPKVNPVTEDTLDTDELLEKLYPDKPKKQPKRKYRTKAEIAEERLRKRRRQGEQERLNDILEETGYPTKEFWQQTPEPEKYYKAYLISRMYNFYAVYYPEKIKNEAEASGNMFRHHLGELIQSRYKDYDVLPERFIGTPNFTIALTLTELLDDMGINPAAYLTVQFDFMEYLINNGRQTGLPYFNALISEKSAKRWDDTHEYRKGFRKEHPYYSISDEVVPIVGYGVPHMAMLVSEYNNPFTEAQFKEYLDMAIDPLVSPKRMKTIYKYYETIIEEVNNNEDLNDEHKEELSKWIEQQTAIHLASRYPKHMYLITSLDQIGQKIVNFEGTNYRELYHQIGTFTLDKTVDQIELKVRTKHGYFLYFSLAGSSTFYNTLRAMRSSRGVELDMTLVAEAIKLFGERNIPVNEYGDMDVHEIALTEMTEEDIQEESFENAAQIKDKQKFLDFFKGMWYDIKESYVAQSPRDGRKVIN